MSSENATGRQPIPPAKRRRLQQLFEHGSRNTAQGNHDYATETFTQCVIGDPCNLIYLQNFLGNLQKKYNNNKKGGKLAALKGTGARSAIKKATGKEDWDGVVKASCEMLKLNPWDTTALTAMAKAYEHLQSDECQLLCLRTALDANTKDPDINRLAALALARMGQFDQAIACWRRVEQAKPDDEEARRMIGDLTVEKTIHKAGYEEKAASGEGVAASAAGSGKAANSGQATVSRDQELQKAIAKNPEEISNYIDLADRYTKSDQLQEAEKVLLKAQEASGGGDLTVREMLEDVQMTLGHRQLEVAQRRAEQEPSDEANNLVKRLKAEVNQRELEVFAARVQRNPSNVTLKYEMGVRLKRAGKFKEAIQALQNARGDVKHKGLVHMELGDCFHYIEQDKLALASYQNAISEISDRDVETRKKALYRAGIMGMRLKEWDVAEGHLSELANLDFSYKDVSKWLDKLGQMRHKQ